MENGRQLPSRNRINTILHRLVLPDRKYFALPSKHEIEIDTLQKEIVSCNVRFHPSQSREKQQIFVEGMKKIQELEAICEKNDQITKQFLLYQTLLTTFDYLFWRIGPNFPDTSKLHYNTIKLSLNLQEFFLP